MTRSCKPRLRAGIPLNYGCNSGNCGDCQARLLSGRVSKIQPHDFLIKEADKAKGALLMCAYTAVGDIVIEANIAGAGEIPRQTIATRVQAIDPIITRISAVMMSMLRVRPRFWIACAQLPWPDMYRFWVGTGK